jgi:serine/threonine protein kinase
LINVDDISSGIGDVLGKGSFGVVMRAIWTIDRFKKTTQVVAVKIISSNKNDNVVREVMIVDDEHSPVKSRPITIL